MFSDSDDFAKPWHEFRKHYLEFQKNILQTFKDIRDNFLGNIKFIQHDICFLWRIYSLGPGRAESHTFICSHYFVTLWLQCFSIVLIVERTKIFKARGPAFAVPRCRAADSPFVQHYFIQADICFLYSIFNLELGLAYMPDFAKPWYIAAGSNSVNISVPKIISLKISRVSRAFF